MALGTVGTPMDAEEQQIAFHQAESIRLKSLFNEHSLFNAKLPPEVLMLIFLECARSFHQRCLQSWGGHRGEYYGEASHKPLYRWIRVSQVCKHWRKIALDCAELWTLLVLDERIHPRLYKTILERSCGLPLTIILHATHNVICCPGRCRPEAIRAWNYTKAMTVFRRVLVNARHLSVFIDREDHTEVWQALRTLKRAEGLQSLRIQSLGYATFNDQPNVSAPVDLLAPSSLRSLKVIDVALSWSNTLLGPGIRHLDLSKHYFMVLPSVDEMLSALQHMQQLETLFLDQAPSEDSLPEGYTRRVTLPCLRWLRTPLKSPASSTLIPFLQLPLTTSVDFFTEPPGFSYNNDEKKIPERTIVALAKVAVGILKDLVVYAVEELLFSHDKASCKFWAGPLHAVDVDVDADTSQQRWKDIAATPYRLKFDASLLDPVMMAVLAAIDLRHVHTLRISGCGPTQARTLLESVRAAQNLTTLTLSREVCFPIGAILAGWRRPASMDTDAAPTSDDNSGDDDRYPDWYGYGDPGDGDGDGDDILDSHGDDSASSQAVSAALLFPRLRTLHLSEFDFPMAKGRERPHSLFRFYRVWYECFGDVEYGLDVHGLAKALRTRVARGAEEVFRIQLDDCQCEERERLVPLVEVVPEVWLEGKRVTLGELGSGGTGATCPIVDPK